MAARLVAKVFMAVELDSFQAIPTYFYSAACIMARDVCETHITTAF